MANTNEPEQRSNVDWRARQRNRQIASAIRLIFVVALLGVLVGVGIVYYGKIKEFLIGEKQTQVEPPPPPKKVIETPKAPPVTVIETPKIEVVKQAPPPVEKAVPKVEVQVVEGEEQRAKQLIEQGNLALLKTDFAAAKKTFDEAVLLRATQETHVRAQKLAHKAEQFDMATSHVKISDFAKAETSWVIELREGRTLRGLLVDEKPETLTLLRVSDENPAATGTVKVPIPRIEIERKREVPITERQKEFLELLGQLESSLALGPDARAADYFDLIVLSRRLGLNDKCLTYLEAAYQKAPDLALGTLYRKMIIDRALDRATLLAVAGRRIQAEGVLNELTRKTLPGYGKAADAADAFRLDVLSKIKDDFRSTIALKASPPPEERPVAAVKTPNAPPTQTPTKPPKPPKPTKTAKELATAATTNEGGGDVEIVIVNEGISSSNPRAEQFIQQGNKFYEDGMAEYRKYRQGTQGNNNAALKAAMGKLEKAVDLYGQALDLDKNNRAISDRQVEANMIVYACKKYQTL